MQNSQFGLVLTIILIIALVWIFVRCTSSKMMPINEDYAKYRHLDLAYSKYPISYQKQLYKSQKGTARPYLGYLYDFDSPAEDYEDDSSYQQQQNMHYGDSTDKAYEDQAYRDLDYGGGYGEASMYGVQKHYYGVDKGGNVIRRTPSYYDPARHSEGAPQAVMGYDPMY